MSIRLRKYDTYTTSVDITAKNVVTEDEQSIPAGTELLFSRVIGGVAPVVMYIKDGHLWEAKVASRFVRTLIINERDSEDIEFMRYRLFLRDKGLRPLVDREFRVGDIVESMHLASLDKTSNLPKRHRMRVVEGGSEPVFELFHPLEYVKVTVKYPSDIRRIVKLVATEDQDTNPDSIAAIRVSTHDHQDDSRETVAVIGVGNKKLHLTLRDGVDEVVVRPMDQERAAHIAAFVRDSWSLSDVRKMDRPRHEVSDNQILRGLVAYHQFNASGLMRFAEFIRQQELIAWRNACIQARAKQAV